MRRLSPLVFGVFVAIALAACTRPATATESAAPAIAFVAAAIASLEDSALTDVEADDVTLRRVQARLDDEVGTFTVMPIGDTLIVAVAEPEHDVLIERTLTGMLEPGLEQLLPASVDDRPLEVFVMPGEAFPASGGDICAIVCPGEAQAMASGLGVDITDVRIVFGGLQDKPELAVIAFEFPGVSNDDLLAIREKLGVYDSTYERTELTIDGKPVLRYRDSQREQWLYAKNGVLFLIYVEHVDDGIPPLVEEAVQELP